MPTPAQALRHVPNAREILPDIVTGGQPSAADLEAFSLAGGGLVVDLRDPMEPRPLDEPALAARLELEYLNVPVASGCLDDTTLDRILAALRGAGGRTVLVHCASGSRAGGALLAYLMLDRGLDEEEATGQAMRAGLRSAELLEWSLDYSRRNRARETT
ncbi:MAG: hypothetical protein H0T44_12015 [Gemmatimonadales bacterium]|nr:hypothetical protein [Gemmatimonadales bacterium]MDQ3426838.1 sulfur transferase domain-containing protein [Gemmatimonadota bacterium]